MPLSSDTLVFIYGAMRSGTTVFRLMLDAHPQIANPGEKDFLFEHLFPDDTHDSGWRYNLPALRDDRIFRSNDLDIAEGLDGLDLLASFLDQIQARNPGKILSINLHREIDKVLQIMPDVRILHMLRDPRDVARSSIQMGWAGTLYNGVGHWIRTERDWDVSKHAVKPEQCLEFSYETLFRDIDGTLKKVCDFFAVPFDPGMLRYHENTTYGPPDVSLTEQWKRKCSPAELEEVEHKLGDLLEARGYAPSQAPIELTATRKLRMKLKDRAYVWRFNMKRYGAFTYWGEKLARRMGFKSTHRRLKLRMQAVETQHAK